MLRVGLPRQTPANSRTERTRDRRRRKNVAVKLARLAWLLTTVACLLAALVLAIRGRSGYAAVTFAVALAASINLF
jgi:hypothetical protein